MARPKKRMKGKKAARTQTAKRKAKATTGKAAHGQIGPQTYEQVRKLVDEKKLPIGKAFEEVAKATGRQPGTIAVTYYRIARKQDGPNREKRAGKVARRSTGRRAIRAGRVSSVLSRVSEAIKELEEVIAHQAQEIARLTNESKLADRIREALRE